MAVTLKDFIVFDVLKVHALTIEKKQVKAKYTLAKKNGESVSNELIYSYDENVFDRSKPEDINMASMMVAQVAINYGLFCEKIIFEGLYDEYDKRLVIDMIENTCREIYVHKLLHPTEFLKAPFNTMKPAIKTRYTAAIIEFDTSSYKHYKLNYQSTTNPDNTKYAILSSGGKDSLLTYGILKEKFDTHPIYVNESGRHWYTAYNAYHEFKNIESNTAKVWCNSDRIFNWMVKQMPFIKENFQNIRSDQYPIRLWTVAVFLYGVLPLARKRNIGNIIIGNEYDTSLKLNYEGITHYAALYDQSKYFDNTFTRYYRKKSWNLHQFSLLRSLSELLILKILVKRYPDLQKHQVSCHAAHKESDRMLPCGKCEKCRRIIGMLKALDENPTRCGYTEDQVLAGLKALETKSVKQLGSDAQHLYHILVDKNLITVSPQLSKMVKSNPEIMSLRFDQERSNTEDLPVAVRKHLFGVLSEYADGVVKMKDRKWHPYKMSAVDFSNPYFIDKKEKTS